MGPAFDNLVGTDQFRSILEILLELSAFKNSNKVRLQSTESVDGIDINAQSPNAYREAVFGLTEELVGMLAEFKQKWGLDKIEETITLSKSGYPSLSWGY